ncbi:MAG: ABC transporter ATP-binding protein, partial [Kiloniellales bacterium]
VLIGDVDVTALPATDRDVSMVFQSYALFPHMTVIENVSYGLTMSKLPKAEVKARAEEGLRMVGLEGYGARLPSELSGGQQQRVAVARALVLEPAVLLFDEPLSNLDAKLRRRVREDIRELQQKLGLTSVYVTHDQEEALAVSDKIIVMRNAEIAQEGTPHDLYDAPADRFVADFIGDANLVDAEIEAVEDGAARVRIGSVVRTLPARGLAVGPAQVAIRPESIRVSTDGAGETIEGLVKKATYLGSHMEYTLDTPLGELFAVDPDLERPAEPGATVGLSLGQRGVTLVRG